MNFIKIECNCEGSKSNYTCNYNHIITRILKGICACVIDKLQTKNCCRDMYEQMNVVRCDFGSTYFNEYISNKPS